MTVEDSAAPGMGTATSVAAADLLVVSEAGNIRLAAGSTHRVGRDPQGAVVLGDPRVSWAHGELRADGGTWIFTDPGSTNGTWSGKDQVSRVEIGDGCVLRLGHPHDGPVLSLAPETGPAPGTGPTPGDPNGTGVADQPPPADGMPTVLGDAFPYAPAQRRLPGDGPGPASVVMLAPGKAVRIGRAPDSDLVVDDLTVSRRHAELRPLADGRYEIVDEGSHNGTFVNGAQITSAPISELDIIGIGHSTFRIVGGELRQFLDEGEVTVVVHDLVVQVQGGKADGKIILDHVSFPIPKKCLLGVIGPSGAGKSTLLHALTGMRPADTGAVLYDNRDLYEHYAELRHRIGLVPQDNILHTQLTARRALEYSAELRFPADTNESERAARVTEVLGELGLSKHAGTRADKLSGGQLKRVNVAQELLTRPTLLFLDEPTSGLDPGLDKSVMEQLRDLAHDGRTVIVVTHSVLNLGTCDRLLIMAPGGQMAFYGPPDEALPYFGAADWAEVYQAFDVQPGRNWAAEFAESPAYAQYVALRHKRLAQENEALPVAPPPQRRGWARQTLTLTRRYANVIWSDRGYVYFMALLPLVLGGLIRFVPAKQGLAGLPGSNLSAQELLSILTMCTCLAGTSAAIRELVKERPIYIRERAAGLSAGGYLFSKVVLLGAISIVQSLIIVVLGLAGRQLPAHGVILTNAPLLELLIPVAGLALASMCLGLMVSAFVSTSEKAMPFLVMLTIGQVILSGGVLSLAGMAGLSQLAWVAPARWAYAAMASTVNLNLLNPPTGTGTDPLWGHTSGDWTRDIGITLGLAVVFLVVTLVSLRRLDPRGRHR
jgi:ABC-type multidrug transport system ATPase subunit